MVVQLLSLVMQSALYLASISLLLGRELPNLHVLDSHHDTPPSSKMLFSSAQFFHKLAQLSLLTVSKVSCTALHTTHHYLLILPLIN